MSDPKVTSTDAVHAGEPHAKPYDSVPPPVVQTATYTFKNTAEIDEAIEREPDIPEAWNNRAEILARLSRVGGLYFVASGYNFARLTTWVFVRNRRVVNTLTHVLAWSAF